MEFDDLSHRVIGELKSVGIEDCAVITKTVSQHSRRQPTFLTNQVQPIAPRPQRRIRMNTQTTRCERPAEWYTGGVSRF